MPSAAPPVDQGGDDFCADPLPSVTGIADAVFIVVIIIRFSLQNEHTPLFVFEND